MKAAAMAKGLRLVLTAAEARFVALALEDVGTPATAPIAAGIRRGLVEVDAKQAAGRAKRAADRARKAAEPTYRHFEVDGHRVSACQADWFDASHDPDTQRWERVRADEPWQVIPAQTEHRPGWWMVFVWPTEPEQRGPLGDQLIEHITNVEHAARAILANVLVPSTEA